MVPRQLSELEMIQYIKQQVDLVGSIVIQYCGLTGSKQRLVKRHDYRDPYAWWSRDYELLFERFCSARL